MTTFELAVDGAVEDLRGELSGLLTRQRQAFVGQGPPDRPSPLVAYWYGPDGDDFRRFVRSTRNGGVARNDFAAQMIPSAAPFGGVGRSGMGAYHGKAGFDAFTHYRTVVGSDLPFSITGTAAPPFRTSMKLYAATQLWLARNRTRRRNARTRRPHGLGSSS